jgi:hypothetical protein
MLAEEHERSGLPPALAAALDCFVRVTSLPSTSDGTVFSQVNVTESAPGRTRTCDLEIQVRPFPR